MNSCKEVGVVGGGGGEGGGHSGLDWVCSTPVTLSLSFCCLVSHWDWSIQSGPIQVASVVSASFFQGEGRNLENSCSLAQPVMG